MSQVALYGGLCALASFGRSELRSRVVESAGFKTLLELYPQVPSFNLRPCAKHWARATLSLACALTLALHAMQVREAVHDFYLSRYASCLDHLAKLRADLCLDLHLHDHVKQVT